MTAAVIGFVVIAGILCVTAVFAVLGVGQIALSGAGAIERDGLARGQRAPRWSLTDSAGVVHRSPSTSPLQLIVFADHSLKSFPSVVAGLRELRDTEVVILTRGLPPGQRGGGVSGVVPPGQRGGGVRGVVPPGQHSEGVDELVGQLGLGHIPVLAGSAALYGAYNVRVMPFAIFVDSAGLVRASSLVNHDWQIAKLRQVAAIPPEADQLPDWPRAPVTSAV